MKWVIYVLVVCMCAGGYLEKNGKVIRNNGKQAIAKIFAFLLFFKSLCQKSQSRPLELARYHGDYEQNDTY